MGGKPNGEWRAYGDYRLLNIKIVPVRYPIPNMKDFTIHLKNKKKIFSKIDLTKAFHQIPTSLEDIEKTSNHSSRWIFIPKECVLQLYLSIDS